tara:strand:+ start:1225 stop:1737 length:513 start_codon:yes stop_codon:yes gene_type:complete
MKNNKMINDGMTFPELILAIFMLTAFTGITVMVTKYTSRFFQPLNQEVGESNEVVKDILNDHTKINYAFDSIIEFLSEPGINKNFIINLQCTSLPSLEWKIPSIDSEALPKSYKICIKPTSLSESNFSQLLNSEGKPGIYILYSKPEGGISVNATPVRRIFCRPKPFCKL